VARTDDKFSWTAALNRLSPASLAVLILPGAVSYLAGVPPTDPAVVDLVKILAPCIVAIDVASTVTRSAAKLVSALHVTCTTREPSELTLHRPNDLRDGAKRSEWNTSENVQMLRLDNGRTDGVDESTGRNALEKANAPPPAVRLGRAARNQPGSSGPYHA